MPLLSLERALRAWAEIPRHGTPACGDVASSDFSTRIEGLENHFFDRFFRTVLLGCKNNIVFLCLNKYFGKVINNL